MIGARLDIETDRFMYVWGLLIDEGLAPDEHFMAAGGATIVVTQAGWDRLDAEVQGEVARFMRSTSEVEVQHVEDDGAGDSVVSGNGASGAQDQVVADAVPAGVGNSGAASPATGARSRARRPGASGTNEGAH